MKKIMVALVTLISLGASAQVDSMHSRTNNKTWQNSDGDSIHHANNPNKDFKSMDNSTVKEKSINQDGAKVNNEERGNTKNPKQAHPENSNMKTTPPAKQNTTKNKAASDKDKIYLVPDSTLKKNNK